MRIRRVLAPLAAALMLSVAAVPASATSEPEVDGAIPVDLIEGITWLLQQQAVDGQLTPVPEDVTVTLVMDGGEAGGVGGCNQYFGSYTLDGDAIAFSGMGSTEMYCEGGGSEVEAIYLANLAHAASAVSTGGSMIMADAAGQTILEYVPAEAHGSGEGPVGVTWLLRHQETVGDSPLGDDLPMLLPLVSLVMQDGQAGGASACNSYFTSYELDGSALSFGPIGGTKMACPTGLMDIERAYFANLAQVASWAIEGDRLVLSDAGGAAILEYEAAPERGVVGSWVASGINNGSGGVETSDITPLVTAEFHASGDLAGFDGCNDYSTTYQVDGDAISISPQIGSTKMACASEEHSDQVQQYYAALEAATTWAVGADGALELRDDGGALQVRYTPAGA